MYKVSNIYDSSTYFVLYSFTGYTIIFKLALKWSPKLNNMTCFFKKINKNNKFEYNYLKSQVITTAKK